MNFGDTLDRLIERLAHSDKAFRESFRNADFRVVVGIVGRHSKQQPSAAISYRPRGNADELRWVIETFGQPTSLNLTGELFWTFGAHPPMRGDWIAESVSGGE